MTELKPWVDNTLVNRLQITGSAWRTCKNSPFENIPLIAYCLRWLATTLRSRWIRGSGSLNDLPVADAVRNAHCGSDAYPTFWNNDRLDIRWHIKSGGNSRKPERCLRIYYGLHDLTRMIVVDHMPSHRRNALT